jgi:hypothetical protein
MNRLDIIPPIEFPNRLFLGFALFDLPGDATTVRRKRFAGQSPRMPFGFCHGIFNNYLVAAMPSRLISLQ